MGFQIRAKHLWDGEARERRVEQVCGVARKALQVGVPLLVGTDSMKGRRIVRHEKQA